MVLQVSLYYMDGEREIEWGGLYFLNFPPKTKTVWYSFIRRWHTGGRAWENLFTMIMNKLSYTWPCLPLTVIVIKERDWGKSPVCVCVCGGVPFRLFHFSREVDIITKTSLLARTSCHVTIQKLKRCHTWLIHTALLLLYFSKNPLYNIILCITYIIV